MAPRAARRARRTDGRGTRRHRIHPGRPVRDRKTSGEPDMKLVGVELRRIAVPLVAPFRTSFATLNTREILLVRVETGAQEGYGECVTMADPLYSSEYTAGAADVLRRHLVPALTALPDLDPWAVAPALA